MSPKSRITKNTLLQILREPLVPLPDNFTPPSRTPWGGKLITQIKAVSGLIAPKKEIVGESWEISSHPSFPNRFRVSVGKKEEIVSIGLLDKTVPNELYGKGKLKKGKTGLPFIVKFVNSGSWEPFRKKLRNVLDQLEKHERAAKWNRDLSTKKMRSLLGKNNHLLHQGLSYLSEQLKKCDAKKARLVHTIHQKMMAKCLSIQIHPPAKFHRLKKGEHSKTEAWFVIEAEKGAGIYLGLKKGVTKKKMENALKDGKDITDYLNFIEVRAGDVFFIPAGTPHAIGAGLLLYEPQENSETTYRYYDYDRTNSRGEKRKLDIKDAIQATNWKAAKGMYFIRKSRCDIKKTGGRYGRKALTELLINKKVFALHRISFKKSDVYESGQKEILHALTIIKGSVLITSLSNRNECKKYPAGRSVIIPACIKRYKLIGKSKNSVVLQLKKVP